MSKYFLSFTSTFESLLIGKITLDDLAQGTMVLGCKREHVLLPYDVVPVEVTALNKVKPKQTGHAEHSTTVSRNKVDYDLLRVWDSFAAQVRKASTEGRLIFLREIGHPSYHRFAQEVVGRGDQAFWHGHWVNAGEPAVGSPADSIMMPAPSLGSSPLHQHHPPHTKPVAHHPEAR